MADEELVAWVQPHRATHVRLLHPVQDAGKIRPPCVCARSVVQQAMNGRHAPCWALPSTASMSNRGSRKFLLPPLLLLLPSSSSSFTFLAWPQSRFFTRTQGEHTYEQSVPQMFGIVTMAQLLREATDRPSISSRSVFLLSARAASRCHRLWPATE